MENNRNQLIKSAVDTRDFIQGKFYDKETQENFFQLKLGFTPYNQTPFGSCAANAVAGAIIYTIAKSGHVGVQKKLRPSRMFLYNLTRFYEGHLNSDNGCQLRNVLKVARMGFVKESEFPYIKENIFTHFEAPEYKNKIGAYYATEESVDGICDAIQSGYPVIAGMHVFANTFSMNKDAVIQATGTQPKGGHGVLITGFDRAKQLFTVRNSYGKEFGKDGDFFMPFSFVNDGYVFDTYIITGMKAIEKSV